MTNPEHILNKYLAAGEVIAGRYQLERVLGSGAYGAIYTANDLISHERVAIKALPPRAENTSQTAFDRFQREMQIIGNLVHKNIIALYDYGETEQGVPYMVIEYVEGETLDAVVARAPMSLDDGIDVLAQLLQALQAAHKLGVVHRDLKPANVMISGEPGLYKCKVLDFGMAKVLESLNGEDLTQLTREGVAVGTPRYIAPEQARGLEVGPYTDIYAAGLLTYELFTGARAVKANAIEAAVAAHVSPRPLDLPEIDAVPEPVRPIMYKMMAKAVHERYQHAGEVLAHIDRLQTHLRRMASGPLPEHFDRGGVRADAPQKIDLDYDRIEEFEEERKLREPKLAVEKESTPLIPPVKHPVEYVERLLCLPVAFLGFVLISTIIPIKEPLLRGAFSIFPILLCAIIGWVLRGKGPFTIARMTWISGVACFVLPHVLNLKLVTSKLLLDPTWFLEPFSGLPGATLLMSLVKEASGAWATMLSGFL